MSFDFLLSKEQLKIRDEARDFIKWVPRQMILDMDADQIKFPKEFLREAGDVTSWAAVTRASGVGEKWIGLRPAC